jgi:hypothetical protein
MNWTACEVEFADEFGEWWDRLATDEQESVRAYVKLLEDYGVALKHPYCSGVTLSRHPNMGASGYLVDSGAMSRPPQWK